MPQGEVRQLEISGTVDSYLTVTFDHPLGASDLTIGAQSSLDLKMWKAAVIHRVIDHGNASTESWTL